MSEEERKISDDKCDSCACSLLDERDKLRDLVAEKDKEIAQLKQERRWIPVEERLPEETECGTDVLVAIHYGEDQPDEAPIICCGYVLDDEWWTYVEHDCGVVGSNPLNAGDKVTHWMPLPEPPKEE